MGTSLKDRAREARLLAGEKTIPPWAKKVGVSTTAIYLIEDGSTRDLKADTAESMARLSGLNAAWIRTGKGNKRNGDPAPLAEPDNGFESAQMKNSLHAIRLALAALFTEMARTRPAEGERVAELIRATTPANFQQQGLLDVLLGVLDEGAKAAPARKRTRPPGSRPA